MKKIYIFTMLTMSLLSTFSICAQPVARISGNTYSTLSDAFAAVSPGDTVHLLSNIICTEGIVIDRGVDFVFDGGGRTIMADFPANNYTLFSITSDVDMVMQNLSIVASSSVEGTLVELADSAGATLHVTNCVMTGYTLFQNYKTNTLVLSENNCTAEYDVVEYNNEGSTVTFKSGHYSANTYAIVDYNYGTTIIEDGTYETVDDIVYDNYYRLYIQGGTFTSDDNFVAYCDGYTEISNVTVTCQNQIFYSVYDTVTLVIRSGTFNSGNNYCIDDIDGNVIVYGGTFNTSTEYVAFIDNGFLHIAGPATFHASNGSAGVFNDITKVGISCQYEFVPSIGNPFQTATVEKAPVTLNFYVGTDIYMSESAFPGCSSVNLPELPAGYPYWVDYFGRRVYRIGEITGDADYFAYKEPDSVRVTFIDGLDTTIVKVLNHTTLGDIAHFSSITAPSFYGWRDADLVTYAADYELTANRVLYAYYLPDGEVVCTFAELQAAVLAEKPVIKLCDMIEVPSTLKITASTLITGIRPGCGLLRPEGFAGNLIYVYADDTLSITLQGITIDGQNVVATGPAVYTRDGYRSFAVYNESGRIIRYDYEYGCSELNILDCEFRNNNISDSYNEASALYSECFKTVICNSLFENNQGGSTIELSDGNVNDTYTSIIRNSRILHNMGTGIIAHRQDTVEIFDSQISYNNAGLNGDGGGIDLYGTDAVILRGTTTISYNTARYGGGCYASEVGRLIMRESSKITHNTACTGGGIHCDELYFEMYDNSEVSFNSAVGGCGGWRDGSGGGIIMSCCGTNVIADNAAIFGNYASGDGGGIYNDDQELDFRGGVIYGNMADGGGHDFYGDVWDRDIYINFQMTFPPRTLASDTTGIQTIWVDEIPGVTAPGYVHVPFAGWFTDEEIERFTDIFSGHDAILSYLTYRDAYAKTVWYGLLLDYNSNNPSAIDFIDSTAYAPHSEAPIADNMFSYPGYKFLGWNTQADGSGDEILPNDTLPFDVHSIVLYAQWCLILHDTILVDACSSYEWNGVTYTESDTVDFLTTAADGCDSIATLILTISLPVEQKDTVTICSSELPYTWRDTTFLAGTVSGDYALLRQTVNGCDSTMKLHLTVNTGTGQHIVTTSDTVCYNGTALLRASAPEVGYPQYYTWISQDMRNIVYQDTVDGTIKTESTFLLENQQTDTLYYVTLKTDTVCPSMFYDDSIFVAAPTPRKLYVYNFDCDIVNGISNCDAVEVRCTDSIRFFGAVMARIGFDPTKSTPAIPYHINQKFTPVDNEPIQFVLTAMTGEFATLVVKDESQYLFRGLITPQHLPITITSNSGDLTLRIYNEYIYDFDTVTATFEGYVTTTNHCTAEVNTASVYVLSEIPAASIAQTTCQSATPFSYMGFNDIDVSVPGDYAIDSVFTSSLGCDSAVTLNLTVSPNYELKDTVTICENELPYTWRDTTFLAGTVSGDYAILRQTAEGCDSTMLLHLTVNPSYELKDTVTICENELPWTWRDTAFLAGTVSGDYAILRQTAEGCDSTMKLHLTVNPSYELKDTVTICTGMLPYTWNGVTFNAAGTQTVTLSSADLCDSVIIMTLIVNDISISVESINNGMCGGESSITLSATGEAPIEYSLDGVVFQSSNVFSGLASGSYTVTARDANGCTATTTAVISPVLTPSLTFTCPPDIRDTLAYGDCAMKIYPAELGTPTAVHSLGWPFTITNDAPADSLYPEGDNIVMWIMKDDVCGFADTCYQHILVVFPECPDAVDCEGNVYAGVRIGCDCWTQRNLESTKYSDCTDIPCVYEYVSADYPNAAANVAVFGRLYCFEAAVRDSADNGHGHIQGICPAGWYLPTPEKYEALNAYGAEALRSPLYWITGAGNNSTGFTALPAGYYNGSINRYENLLGATYFWSTSNTGGGTSSSAYSTFLNCDYILQVQNAYGNGYSVRCIKEKE